jgi:hypothetical protein
VAALPPAPVVVATEPDDSAVLLGDPTLEVEGGHAVCLDVALDHRRGDVFVVSDLDEAGWVERFTASDATLAPRGQELIQAQIGVRAGEPVDDAEQRLEALLDLALPDWRARTRWRRRQVMRRRSGAIDLPGLTWRDRPAIDRGDGVYLAGDAVAAPGLLCEVSVASARHAVACALTFAARRRRSGAAS